MTRVAPDYRADPFDSLRRTGLYVLFDPETRADWRDQLAAIQDAGVRWFQLRSKQATSGQLQQVARQARIILDRSILIINDDLSVALASDADGIHVGPDDLAPARIRNATGPGFLVGRSGDDPAMMAGPDARQIDYFGVGTVRPTASKQDAGDAIGVDGIRAAAEMAERPVIAIGGLTIADLPLLRRAGATAAAVLSGIWGQPDPAAVAHQYLDAWAADR